MKPARTPSLQTVLAVDAATCAAMARLLTLAANAGRLASHKGEIA